MWILMVISLATAHFALSEDCPEIVSRSTWAARIPIQIQYAVTPIKYAVIHHTVTPKCTSDVSCSQFLRNVQNFHMNDLDFDDIGYNFVIGGDGKIYEGVGWRKIGAHTYGYNSRSVGIAFCGNYVDEQPDNKMLEAAKKLLQCGVDKGILDGEYKLIGALQVSSTQSPGLALYREIQKWPHYAKNA